MNLQPIGIIHSPFKDRKRCPPQGREEICWIELSEQYAEGLKDVDGFSHLILFYWLHGSKNYSLLVKTPWDSEPHGVFATRSSNRPNTLGFSVVELIERDGRTVNDLEESIMEDARKIYSEKVIERWVNPGNRAEIRLPDGFGKIKGPCG